MSLLEPHLSLGLAPIILTIVILLAILTCLVTMVTKVSLVNLVANTNPVYAPMLHEELNINLNLLSLVIQKVFSFENQRFFVGAPAWKLGSRTHLLEFQV